MKELQGFWQDLERPIIGLAPMDGVTDSAFRAVMATHGHPHPIYTEFTSVEGIRAGATRLLNDFRYSEAERPIIAQLFGSDPTAFFGAAAVATALGFDGVDINMGCPAKNVTQHGAGAALILDPTRAQEIIRQTRAGIAAWVNGQSLQSMDLPESITNAIVTTSNRPRTQIPVSVKTRVGYDKISIEEWVTQLLEEQPIAIALHGRTLKQGYTGLANWEAIAKGAQRIKQAGGIVLGNGDIQTLDEAKAKITENQLDGVLVGRAACGNPWFFQATIPSFEERRNVALEHAEALAKVTDNRGFIRIRKHLADYFRGVEGIKELRQKLMRVETLDEVKDLLLQLQF